MKTIKEPASQPRQLARSLDPYTFLKKKTPPFLAYPSSVRFHSSSSWRLMHGLILCLLKEGGRKVRSSSFLLSVWSGAKVADLACAFFQEAGRARQPDMVDTSERGEKKEKDLLYVCLERKKRRRKYPPRSRPPIDQGDDNTTCVQTPEPELKKCIRMGPVIF